MGAYLSKPVTEKIIEDGENQWIRFASTSMQGWRVHQEDAHNCILDFGPYVSMFAVYDGHGGPEVSQFLSHNFPSFLQKHQLFGEKDDIETALKELFVKFDATLTEEETVKEMTAFKVVEQDESKEPVDKEEAERKEREALIEEAVALSKDSNVSLDSIVRQYNRYRSLLIENAGNPPDADEQLAMDERGNKRFGIYPSPQVVKRRKMQRAEATTDEDVTAEPDSNSLDLQETKEEENNAGKGTEEAGELGNGTTKEWSSNAGGTTKITKGNADQQQSECESKSRQKSETSKGKGANSPTGQELMGNLKAHSDANNSQSEETQNQSSTAAGEEPPDDPMSSNTATVKASSSKERQQKMEEGEYAEEEEEDDPDYKVEEDEQADENEETGDEEEDAVSDEEAEEAEEDDSLDEEDIGTLLKMADADGTSKAGFDSGSTACIAFVLKDRIVVANIGDSRAVLCREGKALELSSDHKPEDELEKRRIEAAGGQVSEDGRVNGGLNLSRAFGDHLYKQKEGIPLNEQMITPLPDVTVTARKREDDFLVIACDGIWNSMSSQQVCDFVAERINEVSLRDIGAEICELCCAKDTAGDGTGCDNETIIVVDLNKNTRPTISTNMISISTAGAESGEPAEQQNN